VIPVARQVWQPIGALNAGGGRTAAHHAPGVGLIHRLVGQNSSFPALAVRNSHPLHSSAMLAAAMDVIIHEIVRKPFVLYRGLRRSAG